MHPQGVFHQNHLKVRLSLHERRRCSWTWEKDTEDSITKTERALALKHILSAELKLSEGQRSQTESSALRADRQVKKQGLQTPLSRSPLVQHRWTVWHWQMDRLTDEGGFVLYCGCRSTVILHSMSASLLSGFLLQNLLICKSIAYIFGSVHPSIFLCYILPEGRDVGEQDYQRVFEKRENFVS